MCIRDRSANKQNLYQLGFVSANKQNLYQLGFVFANKQNLYQLGFVSANNQNLCQLDTSGLRHLPGYSQTTGTLSSLWLLLLLWF